jgi:hypothetical protein
MRGLVASRVPIADGLFVIAALAGVDYLLRPTESTTTLNYIEAWVPLKGWGIWLIAPSLVGFTALRLRRWGTATVCHAILAGAYLGLAFGLVVGVVRIHQEWGWGTAPLWAAVGALHMVFAVIDTLRGRL